jgi:hypothetical protein
MIQDLVAAGKIEEAENEALRQGLVVKTPHGALRHNPVVESRSLEITGTRETLPAAFDKNRADIFERVEALLRRLTGRDVMTSGGTLSRVYLIQGSRLGEDFPLAETIAMAFLPFVRVSPSFRIEHGYIHSERIFFAKLFV